MRPLNDRVIVKVDDADTKSEGGIFLPDNAQEKPLKGTVLSIGPGRRIDDGSLVPVEGIEIGDRVLFGAYAGTEIAHEGETLTVLREADILAVV